MGQLKASANSKWGVLIVTGVTIILGYNNCSPAHIVNVDDNLSSSSWSSGCESILVDTFANGYYKFTKNNCATCHNTGPGSGMFANSNLALAFNSFSLKGESKIAEFAVSNHKPGYTGQQHQGTIAGLRSGWAQSVVSYNSCRPESPTPEYEIPNKKTIAKMANPNANASLTLTYNLQNEMERPIDAFTGGSFSIVVTSTNQGGVSGYSFSNPRFINTSPTAVYFKGIAVYVNGQIVDGKTFYKAERYIPNVANNNSRRITAGGLFHASAVGAAIQVSVAFLEVTAANIDFQPVTYAQLTAVGGIFQTSCASCHGNAGGFAISAGAAGYNRLLGRSANSGLTLVSPYNLSSSLVYERMINAADPMPTAGLLPQSSRDRVRDWILDGAPMNAADIAR